MGGKTGTTTQQVTIPQNVLDRYNSVNAQAQQAAATPFQAYSTNPNDFVAPINQQQQQGIGNINAASGMSQPAFNAAMSGVSGVAAGLNPENFASGVQHYMNPYLQTAVGATAAQLNNINQQQQQQMLGSMIGQGAFGGDRANMGLAALMNQQNLATGQTIAGMENQGFQTAAQNYFQGANQQGQEYANLGGLGAAAQTSALQGAQEQLGAGSLEQQTEQAGKSALYNQFQQQRAYPFQTAQFLANIAEGTGALSGQTTSTTQPVGFFSGMGLATGGRAEKASGGGLNPEGYADGGSPQSYSDQIIAQLFGNAGPDKGAYGLGSSPMGAQGYVPNIQQSQHYSLPQAAAVPSQKQQTLGQAATDIDNTYKVGKDLYGAGKGLYNDMTTDSSNTSLLYAKGGRAGFADGGLPYDDNSNGIPEEQPQANHLIQAAPIPQQQSGGLGSVLKGVAAIAPLFMNTGGRAGFADGGDPTNDDNSWGDWLQKKAYGLGLVDNPSASAVRQQAYGSTPPGTPMPASGLSSSWGDTLSAAQQAGAQGQLTPEFVNQHKNDFSNMADAAYNEGVQSGLTPAFVNQHKADFDSLNRANGLAPAASGLSPAESPAAAPPATLPRAVEPPAGLLATPAKVQVTAPQLAPAVKAAATPQTPAMGGMDIFDRVAAVNEGSGINSKDPNGGTRWGFNLGQFQQVNPNIRSLSDATPQDASAARQKWWNDNGVNDIEKQYGSNFAAAYADLSMLNPNKTKAALAASNDDIGKFFDIMKADLARTPDPQGAKQAWLNRVQNDRMVAMGEKGAPATSAVASQQPSGLNPSIQPASAIQPSSGLGAAMQPSQPSANNGFLSKLEQALAGDPKTANPGLLLPILHGLGAMANSKSRFLGSAILQGVGAGADEYANRQQQLANVAHTQAATRGIDMGTIQKSLQTTPTGNIMWTNQNGSPQPMLAADYLNLQKAGNAPQLLGYVPSQSGTVTGQPEGGAQFMPASATTPTENMLPLPGGVTFGDVSKSYANNEARKASPLTGGRQSEQAIDRGNTYLTNTRQDAQVARDNDVNMNEMNRNLANVIQQGTGGIGSDARARMVNYVNTVARNFGMPEISNQDTQDAIAKKMSAIIGSARARGGDQTSYAALNELGNAIANPNQPPEAIAELMSNMMVSNQRAKDKDHHANNYGEMSHGVYSDASKAFESENPTSKYVKEQSALRNFAFKYPDKFRNALEGRYTAAGLDQYIEKATGIKGISRYFVGGT